MSSKGLSAAALPEPRIADCYFEDILQARIAAMRLEWAGEGAGTERRTWILPGGLRIDGPVAERFGIHILRLGADSYAVHLIWNSLHLAWNALTRRQLEESCLDVVLASLRTDLQYLLDQPVLRVDAEHALPEAPSGRSNGAAKR